MKTEIALIKGLKAIKQASWNVRVQTGKMIKPSNSCVIIWKEKNRKFEGMGEAGRYFGISETTVGNICKRDGVLTKGVTLYRMEK